MNIENKERDIKIKIVKEDTDIVEEPKENLPASSAGEPKKERKFFGTEKLAAFFFYALVFLMPVFALPLAVALSSGFFLRLPKGVLRFPNQPCL